MTHWGWYWKVKQKHIPRKLCSQLTKIDSFKLSDKIIGFNIQPLDIRIEVITDHLKVTYRKRKEHTYNIPIERQPCNYGGFRSFFRCPLCQKRMRFLYFAEHSVFLCRKCLNLGYWSQRLRPSRRYSYMHAKIEDPIKSRGGNLEGEKPSYMHKGTYRVLQAKQRYYDSKHNQAINKELLAWYGARAEPYIEEFFDYDYEERRWQAIKNKLLPKP